ncbi:MAG: 2-phospho-L-lactate transferase [Halobacteria archaeon]|nr:2-phospho-L-lactate transferase [Halobacteria archaeon]
MNEVTFVSGGTGTPKLLDGALASHRIDESNINVVVNTGDDIEIAGNLVCPDVDTVLYTLSGIIDRDRWWGTVDDTYVTHKHLTDLADTEEKTERVEANRSISEGRAFSGAGEFMLIGDRDRATHIHRTSLIDEGKTLTEATSDLASSMGIEADVLPMSDDPVSTYIETPEGEVHFQVFWIAENGEPAVENVEFRGVDGSEPTAETLEALESPVVIGPSNPVTSLGPILSLDGVIEALRDTRVVAVSPFVGGDVVSGPAPKLMRAEGLEASTRGVYEAYSEFVDVVVVDETESSLDLGCETVAADTVMESREDSKRLFETVAEAVRL